MIDLIALSAAKKHADLLAMGLTSVSVDNTNKSITFTLAADGSQHTIYFDQPSDGISIVGIEIKNGHLICLMSDGSEIDAGVLPSGGSGGSVPKPLTYDYMPEGYPSKSVQTVTLMEEQEVAFSDMVKAYAAVSPVEFELTEGETYTVVWDGVEYKCVCYASDSSLYIGNPVAFELEATGEPFLYFISEAGYMWGSYDTATTHTIGVTTSPEIITPMSYDYMPEGYPKKSGWSIEWDGNTEGLVVVEAGSVTFCKVSDLLPTDDELIGRFIRLSDGTSVIISSDYIHALPEDMTLVGKDDISIAVVKKDNTTVNGLTFPKKGIYFYKENAYYVQKLTEVITPMAEEFMPSSIGEAIDAVGAVANTAKTTADNAQTAAENAQTAAENAQTTADNAQTAAENAQTAASAKFQLMQQNTVTTTTTIGTIRNVAGSVPVKGLNIAVGSTIKFTADNNVSGETVWDSPVKQIYMKNSVGVTDCLLELELSHDGETYNFTNKTFSSILSNLVIEYEKVIIPKLIYPARNEGAWLPPYLIANCLYLTKKSTSSSEATLYRITVDDTGTLSATEVT